MTGRELIEYIKKWGLEHEPVGTDKNMTGSDLICLIIKHDAEDKIVVFEDARCSDGL